MTIQVSFMRIAHVVWSLMVGGLETMLVNIINEQVKTEDVELFIVNDQYFEPLLQKLSPKCNVIFCRRKEGSRNPLPLIKLNIWLWRYSPDIVHVHSYRLSDIIYDRRRMVRTIHNTKNKCREYYRMKALYSISGSVREYTLKQGFDSVVIENGIPTRSIRKKREYNIHNNCYQLVQVSRLCIAQKGQDILIKAVDILVHQRNITNFILHLIGDGESRQELQQMVSDFCLEEYVVFEGIKTQEYLFEHLADYDCFIQPSRFEGFGLTTAEAIAAKLPVLVSNIEGPLEIIENGRVGMTFKTENPDDLADKLEFILKGRYDYTLTDKAYERVVNRYDVSVTAQKYIQEYKKIV